MYSDLTNLRAKNPHGMILPIIHLKTGLHNHPTKRQSHYCYWIKLFNDTKANQVASQYRNRTKRFIGSYFQTWQNRAHKTGQDSGL